MYACIAVLNFLTWSQQVKQFCQVNSPRSVLSGQIREGVGVFIRVCECSRSPDPISPRASRQNAYHKVLLSFHEFMCSILESWNARIKQMSKVFEPRVLDY